MRHTHGLYLILSILVYAVVPALARAPARALLGDSDHTYQNGDDIPLWANKVGPFTNPRRAPVNGLCC